MNSTLPIHRFWLLGFLFSAVCFSVSAQPTAFTYQGRLNENGEPYTGSAEFQFTLWDAESGGTAVATNDPPELVTPVSNGLFTAELDFGDGVFDGSDHFLQIEVRTTIGPFTTLSPRQAITPAPQAIHATTAANAMDVNMGTISNPTFIGTTTTNTPLDLFVNNQRALRLEDSGADTNNDGNPDGAPNVIGGAPVNFVGPDIAGATIGGGGATDLAGFPEPNTVEDDYGTIGGGLNNTAGRMAFVGGGRSNTASDEETVVGGGLINRATEQEATVGGGSHNTASGLAAVVAGGRYNLASGNLSAIGGGRDNSATGGDSTVPGGENNTAAGLYSFAAGRGAKANHRGTFVWGDSNFEDFASSQTDEFAIRAANGLRIHNQGNGATLLRLETERPWEFRQRSTGSATALELVSLDSSGVANKNFIINTTGGGSVGIGTTSPGYKLHVNGSVAGVGTYNNLSDRRFKKNIQSLTNALEMITHLEGVRFDWQREEHPDMQFEEGRQIGFIAQDLQSVVPEAVSETDEGTLHAAYAQIIPLLVEAVKEQHQKLEAENARLRARIEKLEQVVRSPTH